MTNNVDASVALAVQLATIGIPTKSENAKFTPVAGQVYLTEGVIGDSSAHRPVAGGVRNNRQGIYQVTVMAPKDGTRFPGRNTVETIEAAFAAGSRFIRNQTTVSIAETRVSAPMDMGERCAIVVSIYFIAT